MFTEPYGSSAIAEDENEICSRWLSRSVILYNCPQSSVMSSVVFLVLLLVFDDALR